ELPLLAGDRHRDHVLLNDLPELNAGIEPALHDVREAAIEYEVELDVRVLFQKGRERPFREKALGNRRDVQAKRAGWLASKLAQRPGARPHPGERGLEATVEVRARLGERHAPRRSVEELNPEALFQLAHGLAHGRTGHP